MGNILKFVSKHLDAPKGAYFAGRPLRENFPHLVAERYPNRAEARSGAENRTLPDDEPNGAA